MPIAAFKGIVENGQIILTEDIVLPERAIVYVIVPSWETERSPRIFSPRLADKSRAKFYEKIVEPDDGDEYDEI